MNDILYNKMTDDERMQYIYEIERRSQCYGDLCVEQNCLIEILQSEIRCNASLYEKRRKRDITERRCDEFIYYMRKKYLPEDKATCAVRDLSSE